MAKVSENCDNDQIFHNSSKQERRNCEYPPKTKYQRKSKQERRNARYMLERVCATVLNTTRACATVLNTTQRDHVPESGKCKQEAKP